MNDYWVYLITTVQVEVVVAFLLSLGLGATQRAEFVITVLAANLISHPLASIIYLCACESLLPVEIGVCAVEAFILGFVMRIRLMRAFAISALMNLFSVAVGWLLF